MAAPMTRRNRIAGLLQSTGRRRGADSRRTLLVERLSDRAMPAAIVWVNPVGGSWHVPANWDLNRVPTVGDDVMVPDLVGNQTVTHSTGATAINTLTSLEGISIAGGSVSIVGNAQVMGSFTVAGELVGGVIPAGTTVTSLGGKFTGVAVDGDLIVPLGGTAIVANGITVNGAVKIGGGDSSADILRFDGTQAVSGTGTIQFVANDLNQHLAVGIANSVVTIGAGITIRGNSGSIGYLGAAGTFSNGTFIYAGLIQSDLPTQTILLAPGNHQFSGAGQIQTANGGVVALSGTLLQTTLNMDVVSTLTLLGGTLDNAAVNGKLLVPLGQLGIVKNGLTLNGTATIRGGDSSAETLRFDGTQAVSGTGSILFDVLNDSNQSIAVGVANSVVSFGPAIVVGGNTGYIGYGGQAGTFPNGTFIYAGTVVGDVPNGLVNLAQGTHQFSGAGKVVATNGGIVGLSGTMKDTTVNVQTGSVLSVRGGTLDAVVVQGDLLVHLGHLGIVKNGLTLNGTATIRGGDSSAETLRFDGTQAVSGTGSILFDVLNDSNQSIAVGVANSVVSFGPAIVVGGNTGYIGYGGLAGTFPNGTFIYAGTVVGDVPNGMVNLAQGTHQFSGAGKVVATNGGIVGLSGTMKDTTVNVQTGSVLSVRGGTLDAVVVQGDLLVPLGQLGIVKNGLTLNGTATIRGGDSSAETLRFDGTQAVSGTGSILFDVLNDSNQSIAVGVANSVVSFGPAIVVGGNTGYIGYGGLAGTFPNGTFIYDGIVSCAIPGATVNLTTGIHQFTATGKVQTTSGGVVGLSGTVANAQVNTAPSSMLTSLNGTFDNAVVNGVVLVPAGNSAFVRNGVEVNGKFSLAGTNNQAMLRFDGTQTASGSGTLEFQPLSGANLIAAGAANAVVVFGPSLTVFGIAGGTIGYNGTAGTFADATFINQGTIRSAGNAATVTINPLVFENQGVIEVSLSNSKVTIANAFNNFVNFANNTLTGGTYVLKGTLQFDFANVENLAATLTLDAPNSALLNQANGNGIANLQTVGGAGKLRLLGGKILTTPATLTTSGEVTIGFNCQLASNGPFVLLAGATTVNGSLIASGQCAVVGGTLLGTGTVSSWVQGPGSGTIAPGNSPGLLTIQGNTTLGAGTTLAIELNGVSVGVQYDRLRVVGAVDITGSGLAVTVGFSPTAGATFIVVDNDGVDAVVGNFNGLAEGANFAAGGAHFTITYVGGTGNDVVLTATAATDTVAPTIVGVYFDGSTWSAPFRTAMGNGIYGMPAQTGVGADGQLTPMPWSTVNTVYFQFSENVAIANLNLGVRGINLAVYASSMTYDSANFVAKFSFAAPFDTDRVLLDLDGDGGSGVADLAGNKLAGTWTESVSQFPTTGPAGADFKYRFVVAVGDADRNGLVRNADLNLIRNQLFIDVGAGGYNRFADIDGNGLLRNADLNVARNHLFIDPPAGPGPNAARRASDPTTTWPARRPIGSSIDVALRRPADRSTPEATAAWTRARIRPPVQVAALEALFAAD